MSDTEAAVTAAPTAYERRTAAEMWAYGLHMMANVDAAVEAGRADPATAAPLKERASHALALALRGQIPVEQAVHEINCFEAEALRRQTLPAIDYSRPMRASALDLCDLMDPGWTDWMTSLDFTKLNKVTPAELKSFVKS